MKSKLGVPGAVLAAGVYLMAAMGWYIGVLLLAGCILLCEEDLWLRKAAFNGAALYLCFVGVGALVDLLPDLMDVIASLMATASVTFRPTAIDRVFSFLRTLLNFGRTCTMVVMMFLALKKAPAATAPFGDKVTEKAA